MKKCIFLILSLLSVNIFAQKNDELANKQGTFEILRRTDFADAKLGFTKTDNEQMMKHIENLVTVMRQNQVLADVKGFNGRARIHNISNNVKSGFGVPARVSFEFSSFFYNKEHKLVFNTIEPPEWSLYINAPNAIGVTSDGFDTHKGYFTVPYQKETIVPGIDVYNNESIVIYDANRPDYWIPVTVNEAFSVARALANKETDEYTRNLNKEFLDREWNEIPEKDRDKPAFLGGGLSRVSSSPDFEGQSNIFPPIMKVNPAYFNKSLPKSAIQLITCHVVQDKNYMKQKLNECYDYAKKGSGSGCDLARFELSLTDNKDLQNLLQLIGR